MARPRAFDRQEVVRRAADLFRERGYEATSVRDLLTRLDLSASSLYAAFGGKEGLFMEALRWHAKEERQMLLALLTEAETVRDGFERLFSQLTDELLQGQDSTAGSLTLRAAIEMAGSNRPVFEFLSGYIEELVAGVAGALNAAAAAGELTLEHPAEDLARFLLFAAFDLGFIAQVSPERERLEGYTRVVLATLDRPGTGPDRAGNRPDLPATTANRRTK